MKTWKVWFYAGEARFAIEFKGTYNEACDVAKNLAARIGVGFDYDIEEVQP